MSARKKKALANELIDDLLNDDEMQASKGTGKTKKTKKASTSTFQNRDKEREQLRDQTQELPVSEHDDTIAISPKQDSSGSTPPFDRTAVATSSQAGKPFFGGTMKEHSGDGSLRQANNLRLAQQKILELERELERVRSENEKLLAAGEALRKRVDELTSRAEKADRRLDDAKEIFNQEKEILLASAEKKNRELADLKMANEELEGRINSSIQKIRVRERELENRLELLKMESVAIVRNKDQTLLDLKRQIDQLSTELENFRHRGAELNHKLGEKQEVLRRTVKALRLALSMLEQDTDGPVATKKVD